MAAPLYARYIPPKPSSQEHTLPARKVTSETVESTSADDIESSRKRKRDGKKTESRKKHRNDDGDSSLSTNGLRSAGIGSNANATSSGEGEAVEAVSTNGQKTFAPPKGQKHSSESGKAREKKKANKKQETDSKDQDDKDDVTRRHSKILSKYEKSLQSQPDTHSVDQKKVIPVKEIPKVDDLVPFTLPKSQAQGEPLRASAALPSWISKPTVVPKSASNTFEKLDVGETLLRKLRDKGFENALPIQTAILPLLLPKTTQHPGDVCVSAATGSGKTLGYILPIVQSLQAHVSTRLRALIVVPTRELVDQVRDTAAMCASGNKLHIGTAVGAHHFEREQGLLVEKTYEYDPDAYVTFRAKLEKKMTFQEEDQSDDDENFDKAQELLNLLPGHVPNYVSKVDILVATPGRLVDHIKSTPGFNLANLEWLVIDEADRLLDASFQQWVETLTGAIDDAKSKRMTQEIFPRFSIAERRFPRKVILSATMTRDVEKLSGLRLQNPKMVVLEGGEEPSIDAEPGEYSGATGLPPTLHECAISVGNGSKKPLYLLKILQDILRSNGPSEHLNTEKEIGQIDSEDIADSDVSDSSEASEDDSSTSEDTVSSSSATSTSSQSDPTPQVPSNALVFASSNESAHRLSRLLLHLAPEYQKSISTLTKSSTSRSTVKALASFRASRLRMLIATDRASRGLDLPNLQNVINYDIPHSTTSYVHRVGRTARAGAQGTAWTLVEDREAAWFWKEVAKGKEIGRNGKAVEKRKIELKDVGEDVKEAYQSALEALKKDVELDTRV